MAKSDKRRVVKHPPNTRGRKPRLVSDVGQTARDLDDQLRSMGLRVVPTEGDGNCLFRALSDQMYGTDRHHSSLRKDICDWLAGHPERYRGFVDDDRSLEDHISVMRQLGTYGGHLELSAFAHRFRRDIKVVQPGLVYVISCADIPSPSKSPPSLPRPGEPNEREARRLHREAVREAAEAASLTPQPAVSSTVYVAYHDWEHYSSLRIINGPPAPAKIRDHPVPMIPTHQMSSLPRPRGRPRKHPLPPHRIPLPPSPPPLQSYRDPSPSNSASTSAPSTGSATEASTPPTSNSPKRSASDMSDDDDIDIDHNPRARKTPRSERPSPCAAAEVEAVLKRKLTRKERQAVGRVGGSRVLVRQKPKPMDRTQIDHSESASGDLSFKELHI
ncbi:cysteine proteinase [Dacryopinax primogenitus]|uniref:Cysteine proteinase n=1 Tax=Dacryopinax primogenitus (strain DJM 731) TaxID=1858805 RepID=M5FV34_DACPD|nr:cysteine proteinase [Dacryopinax primogenitus]EJT97156.1 cysteine proteinase [Dacryopinax primogenitus]